MSVLEHVACVACASSQRIINVSLIHEILYTKHVQKIFVEKFEKVRVSLHEISIITHVFNVTKYYTKYYIK